MPWRGSGGWCGRLRSREAEGQLNLGDQVASKLFAGEGPFDSAQGRSAPHWGELHPSEMLQQHEKGEQAHGGASPNH